MARAISRILSVPWSAARTCRTRTNATTRASTQTAMTANRARVSPEPKSTSALASCASSRTGLIRPPRRPSAGALDQARCPGRALDGSSGKSRARAPARRRPGCLPREPAVPRAREDWADHSHGPENRATREMVADGSSQGRRQGFRGAQARPSDRSGAQRLGPATQPEAGPVPAVLEGRGLEVVDQGPDQGQPELAVVDLAVGGVAGVRGRGRGPVADLDPEAVGRLHQVDLDRVETAGPAQVADRDRAGLGDGHLEVLDALLAHARLAGDDADDQPDRAQQARLRREGQADGGRGRTGVGIHGRWLLGRSRDRVAHRAVDGEDLGQAGDPEDLEDLLLGADQLQRAVVVADPLQPTDQHPEPGRVQEVHLLEVDDDVVGPVADQLDELLAELWRGVHVDLAGHLEHRVVAVLTHVEVEIHPLSSLAG